MSNIKGKSKYGDTEKRNIPQFLKKLLDIDALVTDRMCNWSNNFLPLRSLRTHYKLLEVSCHGVPWICGWLAFIWMWDSPSLYQMQVNFIFGMFLDIVIVGVLKAATRRRRPPSNKQDMFATIGPDKFSFPSGHASRACFIAYFFCSLWPVHFFFIMPLMAWATSICISRILLRRHHVLDVLVGAGLGHLEGMIIGYIWLSQQSSAWVVSFLSDERLDGGSYHV